MLCCGDVVTGCIHRDAAYLCPRCGWCFACRHRLTPSREEWICWDGGRRTSRMTENHELGVLMDNPDEARGTVLFLARGERRNPPEDPNVPEVWYEWTGSTWVTHVVRRR